MCTVRGLQRCRAPWCPQSLKQRSIDEKTCADAHSFCSSFAIKTGEKTCASAPVLVAVVGGAVGSFASRGLRRWQLEKPRDGADGHFSSLQRHAYKNIRFMVIPGHV